jgi:DNA-binding response OmpR family regulator
MSHNGGARSGDAPPAGYSAQSMQTGSTTARPRILVVDDDACLVQILSMYLTVEGYEVRFAADGDQALRDLEVFEPHLVILDVMMAGLDGIATCRAIKQHPRWRTVPVIMFTALDREADEIAGRGAGADRYLAKPFSLVGLGEVVRGQIRDHTLPTAV